MFFTSLYCNYYVGVTLIDGRWHMCNLEERIAYQIANLISSVF